MIGRLVVDWFVLSAKVHFRKPLAELCGGGKGGQFARVGVVTSQFVKKAYAAVGLYDGLNRPADVAVVEACILAHSRKFAVKHFELDGNQAQSGNERGGIALADAIVGRNSLTVGSTDFDVPRKVRIQFIH